MLKQADNVVRIEGIILKNELTEGTASDGKEYIRGQVVIRVNLEDKGIVSDIPVRVYATKMTKQGKVNPAYTSAKDVMAMPTIEKDGEINAACVRITNASIGMNEYPTQGRDEVRIVSFPVVNASFFNRIDAKACKPEASFKITGVVATKPDYQSDAEGNVLGYFMNLIIPQYGGRVDIVPFKAANEKVIQVMDSNWDAGSTVSFGGYLNFTVEEMVTEVETDFGEPENRILTRHVSEFIISRGTSSPIEEGAYDPDEIKEAVSQHRAYNEKRKEDYKAKKAAPAPSSSNGMEDLGF